MVVTETETGQVKQVFQQNVSFDQASSQVTTVWDQIMKFNYLRLHVSV